MNAENPTRRFPCKVYSALTILKHLVVSGEIISFHPLKERNGKVTK